MKNIIIILVVLLALILIFLYAGRSPDLSDKGGDDAQMEVKTHDSVMDKKDMADTTYILDQAKSSLGWSASRVLAAPHVGEVKIKSGSLYELNGDFIGGDFVIDMAQISESKNSESFLGHIGSKDFFDVENFPEANMTIVNIARGEGDAYSVVGLLTILDKTNEVSFEAEITKADDVVLAKANFDIDRTRWGINFDSGSIFKQLGDKAIKDEVGFDLSLSFERG